MKKELIVHYQGRPCKRKYPFRRLREARLTPNSLANCGFALGWKAKMPMVVNSFSHTYYYLQIVGKVMHVVDWQNVLIRGQFDALKRIAQIEIWHAWSRSSGAQQSSVEGIDLWKGRLLDMKATNLICRGDNEKIFASDFSFGFERGCVLYSEQKGIFGMQKHDVHFIEVIVEAVKSWVMTLEIILFKPTNSLYFISPLKVATY